MIHREKSCARANHCLTETPSRFHPLTFTSKMELINFIGWSFNRISPLALKCHCFNYLNLVEAQAQERANSRKKLLATFFKSLSSLVSSNNHAGLLWIQHLRNINDSHHLLLPILVFSMFEDGPVSLPPSLLMNTKDLVFISVKWAIPWCSSLLPIREALAKNHPGRIQSVAQTNLK